MRLRLTADRGDSHLRSELRGGEALYVGMKTSDDLGRTTLHALVRVGEDSAAGYATAARDIADPELQRLLMRFHDERSKLVVHLRERIQQLRGDSAGGPTIAGAVHRTWMDFRAGNASNPTEALLSEIERGERLAVEAYRAALDQTEIDPATRELIERQYEIVQAAHDRVRLLRDHATYARSDE